MDYVGNSKFKNQDRWIFHMSFFLSSLEIPLLFQLTPRIPTCSFFNIYPYKFHVWNWNSPFQVLKFILLIKIYKTRRTFVVEDIIFYKILEHHSTLPEKRFLSHFPFLTDLLKPPHPLSSQNQLSLTKKFCWCSLMFFGIPIFLLFNLII